MIMYTQNTGADPFVFPVSRIGNEDDPKLVILLTNPGRNPGDINQIAESKMGFLDIYHDSISGMKFSEYRQKCPWWDNLLRIAEEFGITDDKVLSLEYYMYHTLEASSIPAQSKWTPEARKQLQINKTILTDLMNEGDALIFAYYFGNWEKEMPRLLTYSKYVRSELRQGHPTAKQNEMRRILQSCRDCGLI